jgi:hypothetical protein
VDAYAAQHARREVDPDVPPISIAMPWSGCTWRWIGAHPGSRFGPRTSAGQARPVLAAPVCPARSGAMTVFEVAVAGTMVGSVAGHARAVRTWATAIWQAWAAQQAAVAALTDRLLGGRHRGGLVHRRQPDTGS